MKLNLLDNPELLRQRLIFDAFPHANVADIIVRLGKVPPSEEGAESARKESRQRVTRTKRVVQEIDLMAEMLSEALIRSILGGATDAIGPEIEAHLAHTHHAVIRTGALVVLANLLDAGILTYTES